MCRLGVSQAPSVGGIVPLNSKTGGGSAWSTISFRESTWLVRASTTIAYATGCAASVFSTIASNAGTTPFFTGERHRADALRVR